MRKYNISLTSYRRFPTREVHIGSVAVGSTHPIRVQSMTTTDTMDTNATVAQSLRMIEAGCELVRITAPSLKEAANLEVIRKKIREAGYDTPLIADIHFTPNAAELAARLVEKVRVNPGNYADKKKFANIEYSGDAYAAELDRIRRRFLPLIKICKAYGTAMRIGTNHGSLSDRIMSRYGDTPQGMVESALEFVRICRDENYHELILSMKASNPQVMVQAYRLLVARMLEEDMNYPLHLGVTEAGDGEDGRIKSAAGIGALLEDGLGDTIRVSLTEEPEEEIPVALALVRKVQDRTGTGRTPEPVRLPYDPFSFSRRKTQAIANIGGGQVPRVMADFSRHSRLHASDLKEVGYHYSEKLDKWRIDDQACDYIYLGKQTLGFEIPGTLGLICDPEHPAVKAGKEGYYPLLKAREWMESSFTTPHFVQATTDECTGDFWKKLQHNSQAVPILSSLHPHAMADVRNAVSLAMEQGIENPVILQGTYAGCGEEDVRLYAAADAGALLLDGLIDGLWLCGDQSNPAYLNRLTFGILQCTRFRISKTEYISCPSCGRTLFDLQETTARIRARTSHLKGVKIGIMGCIVNGPGEMADADYGYVGTGPGVITLYKGKEVVQRNIPAARAVDALIDLIRTHGDWAEEEAAV